MKLFKAIMLELAAALLFGAVITAMVWVGLETSPLYGG